MLLKDQRVHNFRGRTNEDRSLPIVGSALGPFQPNDTLSDGRPSSNTETIFRDGDRPAKALIHDDWCGLEYCCQNTMRPNSMFEPLISHNEARNK